MREQSYDRLTFFAQSGSRKYLNAFEQKRFLESAQQLPPPERLFCRVLAWTGARISEGLALTPAAIDVENGVICLLTLKRRRRGIVRQVPLPPDILGELERVFKPAWRYIKTVMTEAGIVGTPAMPKGLRHGFGVKAFQSNVPPHLVQRWLRHASISTTAIYADVVCPEERAFAARMRLPSDR